MTWHRRSARCVAQFSAIVLALASGRAAGTTRIVPTSFPTIQGAIGASAGGDTVLVLPGTYVENIVIDREIVVRSQAGPSMTVLDGGSPRDPDSASVVTISRGSIEGFDIRNGRGTMVFPPPYTVRWGGGVSATSDIGPGPLIHSNWIHDNSLLRPGESCYGAGINVEGAARIVSNRVFHNEVGGLPASEGAGIRIGPTFAAGLSVIEGNEVYDNHALSPAEHGGIFCPVASVRHNVIACNSGNGLGSALIGGGSGSEGANLEGNTIVANWSNTLEAAVYIGTTLPGVPIVANNITHNVGPGLQCFVSFPGSLEVQCNNVFANGPGGQVVGACAGVIGQNGNTSVDPQYGAAACPSVPGDWCLGHESPLLPQNSPPGCGLIGAQGECPPIGVPAVDLPQPERLRALPARPNPFAQRTAIAFHLGQQAQVEVAIYGVLGRKVRTLEFGVLGQGDHEVTWDGRDEEGRRAPSGAYVAAIHTPADEITRTLLLVR